MRRQRFQLEFQYINSFQVTNISLVKITIIKQKIALLCPKSNRYTSVLISFLIDIDFRKLSNRKVLHSLQRRLKLSRVCSLEGWTATKPFEVVYVSNQCNVDISSKSDDYSILDYYFFIYCCSFCYIARFLGFI